MSSSNRSPTREGLSLSIPPMNAVNASRRNNHEKEEDGGGDGLRSKQSGGPEELTAVKRSTSRTTDDGRRPANPRSNPTNQTVSCRFVGVPRCGRPHENQKTKQSARITFRHLFFRRLGAPSAEASRAGYAERAAPTMGSVPPPPSRRPGRPFRLVVMGPLLLLLRADALVLSRGGGSSLLGSGIQPLASASRTRATSATSAAMALGRNSSRSRPAPGKQGRARRSGCGGTPGGADGRAGVRARARQPSYYGDASLSRGGGGGGEPLGFIDVGDVVWGVGRQQQKRSAGASRSRGSSSGFGKYQPRRTAGGTFTARGVFACCFRFLMRKFEFRPDCPSLSPSRCSFSKLCCYGAPQPESNSVSQPRSKSFGRQSSCVLSRCFMKRIAKQTLASEVVLLFCKCEAAEYLSHVIGLTVQHCCVSRTNDYNLFVYNR